MGLPLISIIVPVYNVSDYLSECVESIINQSYGNLEIILIDDGSTDGSGKLCDEYKDIDSRIKVVHKRNGGLSSARNAGLKIANGEYIGFVDSDDVANRYMFEILADLCKNNDVKMSCISFSTSEFESKVKGAEPQKEILYSSADFLKNINSLKPEENITYCVWSKLFKREILNELYFPEGRVYEDVLFTTIACMRAGEIAFSRENCYFYRMRGGSISHSDFGFEFDRRLLTERYPTQLEQMQYLKKMGAEDALRYINSFNYLELCNLSKNCKNDLIKSEINRCKKSFRMTFGDILKLDYKFKLKLAILMKMWL